MKINTDLFYVHHSGYGSKNYRVKKHKAHWCLWFTEDGFFEDRQNLVMSWQFPVKPTKKQIRKLRRQFRKLEGF